MEETSIMDQSAFDKLFRKNVPHILEKIFLSLDFVSFKKSHEVCKEWKVLLLSKSVKEKTEKILRKIRKKSKIVYGFIGMAM